MKKFLLFLSVLFNLSGTAQPAAGSGNTSVPAEITGPAASAPDAVAGHAGKREYRNCVAAAVSGGGNGCRTLAVSDARLPGDEYEADNEESGFLADEHFFLELGYSSGRADAYGRSGRWQVFGTYDVPVRPEWLIGLGCGGLYYPHLEKGFMPVYADFRFNFTPHNSRTPFIDLKIGYAFLLRERDRYDEYYDYDDFCFDRIGGVFFSPSIGAQVLRFNGLALSVSAGYSFHKIDYRDPDRRYVERIGGFHFMAALEF